MDRSEGGRSILRHAHAKAGARDSAQRPKAEVELAPIPEVSGVDVAGLARIVGGPTRAIEFLRRFRRDYSEANLRLRESVSADPTGAGRRFCHELKGLAGNLRAGDAHRHLEALESTLKVGADNLAISECLFASVEAITRLFAAIDGLGPEVAKSDSQDLRGAPTLEEISRLRRYLDAGSLEAEDAWLELQPRFAALDPVTTEAIGRAIDRLDYATASKALSELQPA